MSGSQKLQLIAPSRQAREFVRMADFLLSIPVVLTGLYLVGLAAVALLSPRRARLFLFSFASSATVHFLELSVRLMLGAALALYAPQMRYSALWTVIGWTVVATTIGILVMPWRWHQRFAAWSVPLATRNMVLFALGSLAGGIFVLLSVGLGPDGAN
jgi:hypothetical protein